MRGTGTSPRPPGGSGERGGPPGHSAARSIGGYGIEGVKCVAEASSLPVIAAGGAGKPEHFLAAVREGRASMLPAASVFHFGTLTFRRVKRYLRDNGVPVVL